MSRPALSRATCNSIARGEARRAATGVPEKSSSREGTLHHITSVTTSPAQSVVTSCVCALVEYWTPTHSSRRHILVQCRSRKNGRETSKPYIHKYMCEHACVPYIIIVCTHIFIGACIHVVRYRHACYMHTCVYLLVWVHAHVFVYTRISRTTALGCRTMGQDFGSCGAVVQSRGPVVHQLAGSGCPTSPTPLLAPTLSFCEYIILACISV